MSLSSSSKIDPGCVTEGCVASLSAEAAVASAYWAGASFWVALAAVSISLLTFLAAIAAAKFARDAVRENRRSADAAIEAAQLSDRALVHTLSADRPWLVIEELVSGRRCDPRYESTFFGIHATIRVVNCGSRPAVNGAIEWEYHILDSAADIPAPLLFEEEPPIGMFVLGPGRIHNSEVIKLDVESARGILNGEKHLFVAFRASYEGATGSSYLTQGIIRCRALMPFDAALDVKQTALLAPDLVGRNIVT